MKTKYTKAEAAEFLKVSERAIERYTAKGKLSPETVDEPSETDGRTRPKNYYSLEELRRVKEEMENPPPPGVAPVMALAPRGKQQNMAEFVSSIVAAVDAARGSSDGAELPPSELAHKTMLTVEEGARLHGLTPYQLRKAIRARELKATRRGPHGSHLIRATALSAYVKRL